MIDDFKYIKQKTLELESSVEKLQNLSNINAKTFKSINKNLINYSITDCAEILLYQFTALSNSNILFTLTADFYLYSSQNIEFSLIVNNICISKITRFFNSGKNNITINKDYTTIKSGTFNAKIKIKSLDEKQIEVNIINLIIYGINKDPENVIYQSLETDNNQLLLSYLSGNELYYLLTNKNENYYNYLDFNYYTNAISYSFSYDTDNNKTLLFKVNENNDLTYSIFNTSNEILLDENTTNVSSCFGQNKILVCYIKNFTLYFLTIQNNVLSNIFSLNRFRNLKNTTCTYNKNTKKFYILLTDINNQNYLIESIKENTNNSENISVSINFNIETYEVK